MTPIAMTLCGFGSFKKEQRFEFARGPGLYFMRGDNRAEPRLGANGAGKSTVWRALAWVLFGKDPRGMKAGDVANWADPKGAWASFEYEHAGKLLIVRRSHSPNSWILLGEDAGLPCDLTADDTNPVLADLKLAFAPFLNSVLMAQKQPMFLDLKPEPKAALFSEVMGLDRWVEYASRASKKAEAQDAITRAHERDVAELRGKVQGAGPGDLAGSIADWEAGKQRRLAALAADYAERLTKDKHTRALLPELDAREVKARERLASITQHVELMNENLRGRVRVEQDARTALAVADANLKHAKAHQAAVNGKGDCPTCGQPWGAMEWAGRAGEALAAVTKADNAARDCYGRLRGAEDRLRDEDAACAKAEGALVDARREHDLAKREANDLARDIAQNDRRLDELEDDIDRVTDEENPFAALQAKALTESRELALRLADAQGRLADSADRHAMLRFWVQGFKDIRLRLISEALDQLAIEVNSCVVAHGLVGWELVFEVDRETKGGSISRGFSVMVRSPHNDRQVPWESWSGGEAQRLRLSAQEGLGNLIRMTTGADIPLEVWDEPTDGMSEQGIADLLTALGERARREARQIWVVDHRALGHGGFDGEVTVVKDARSGSRFVNLSPQ